MTLQILQAGRQKRGRNPSRRRMKPEPVQQIDHVRREADAHRHVAARVFENQVPTDDPGHQLAQRRVSVGVGAAGNGNHRSQLRITQPGERTDQADQHDRNRNRRTRPGPPEQRVVVDEEVQQRRVDDG